VWKGSRVKRKKNDALHRAQLIYSRIRRDLVRDFISLVQHFRAASYSSRRRSQRTRDGTDQSRRWWSTYANGIRVHAPMTREERRDTRDDADDNWTRLRFPRYRLLFDLPSCVTSVSESHRIDASRILGGTKTQLQSIKSTSFPST